MEALCTAESAFVAVDIFLVKTGRDGFCEESVSCVDSRFSCCYGKTVELLFYTVIPKESTLVNTRSRFKTILPNIAGRRINVSRAQMSMKSLKILTITLFLAASSLEAADWPSWRGPNRNDISQETGLLQVWPEGGPTQVWQYSNAGLGYSSFAVADGRLFTLGTRGEAEILLAIDADSGKELWAVELSPILSNGWGNGPRGTPTVDGNNVYALTGPGTLVCLSVKDGKQVWTTSMDKFGGRRPGWGYTESVLIDGDNVICTPGGGQGTVLALNKKTGAKVWQSAEFTDGAQYASVVPVNHAGQRQYIQLTQQHVAGIDASSGKLLWKSPFPGRTAVVPTPIYSDGKVYVTSGYGVGCKLLQVGADNGVQEVYFNQTMKNHHGGVLLKDGYLYGYSDGPGWICQDFKTGEMIWNNKTHGKGSVTYADGKLYCVAEGDGSVVLADASPEGWKISGKLTLPAQSQIRSPRGRVWSHPVVANGKLYLRDQEHIFCYDVKAK